MRITKEWLTERDACKEGKEWWLRNVGENFLVEDLDRIEGDFKGYIEWLHQHKHDEFRYEKDKLVWRKHSNGAIYEYKYIDEKLVWKKHPNGNIYEYKYEDGSLVWRKNSNGNICKFRYEDGNLVWKKYPNGHIYEYRYEDDKLVWRKYPSGDVWEYKYIDDKLVWEKHPNGNIYEYKYSRSDKYFEVKGYVKIPLPKQHLEKNLKENYHDSERTNKRR